VDRGRGQIIELRLNRAEEMFALAQTDLFSEYRNFLTGAEYCISLLRSQRIRGPVRLELSLPPSEVGDDLADRISMALRRYCDQRISPLGYGRENRVLRQLRDAEISVMTWQPTMGNISRTGQVGSPLDDRG
jgi:hypothetical protein